MATTYVTLVGFGGTPVRLADQTGAPFPTTGNGALVFANGATLTNVTITGQVIPTPTALGAGVVTAPALSFGSPDRGIYSKTAGDVSIAANGTNIVSFEQFTTSFTFSATQQLNFFSNFTGEAGLQSTDAVGGTDTLTLNKFGGVVAVGGGVALVAGGSSVSSNVTLGTAGPGLYVGTGAPTITAVNGSLYLRSDATQPPYYNTTGSTTWVQLADISTAQTFTNKTLTSPTINGGTITGATISGGSLVLGQIVGTSASANALTTGLAGTTNPTFNVDNSTVAAIAGLNIKAAATGGTVAISTIDTASANNLTINAKGTGTIGIGTVSTGLTTIGTALTVTGAATMSSTTTLSAALTYGGVTLTNAVTGTGSMVLSASPALTGVPTAPTAAANTNTTQLSTTAFVQAALVGLVPRVTVVSVAGTSTYTPNANMVFVTFECWGGGGGGGGTASSAGTFDSSGAGGGAGSYARKTSLAAAVLPTQTITVGAAGTAGTSGNNAGGGGGDSSVGALCVGKGGSGGGGSAGLNGTFVAGGLGGVAGTGDVTSTGTAGWSGGSNTASAVSASSAGGSSLVGGGGRGVAMGGATTTTGEAGTGHASGGSGGACHNNNGAAAGGAGTAGYVIITEFCTH